MANPPPPSDPTLALPTPLEDEFVSPLTAIRGALEILRDFPDLTSEERTRFVTTAIAECARLEHGVRRLADSVYAADRHARATSDEGPRHTPVQEYDARFQLLAEMEVIEVDLSGLEFTRSRTVNAFHDELERLIERTGRRWYLVVNYRDVSIWPEAWVTYAHRSKRIHVNHALATVRYDDGALGAGARASDTFDSRDAAFAHIASLRDTRGVSARR